MTEKEREGSLHSLPVTPGYTRVLVKERKQSLLDRCLLTGLLTGMPLTLSGEELYCPGKRA